MEEESKENFSPKLLSLFSGKGAFEKALDRLDIDYRLENYCEINKYASCGYSAIHDVSEEMNLWDIREIDIDELSEDIDIITHGSPCTDFSIAGKQEGGDEGSDTRSSLMWHTVNIVRHKKPKYVIWENVTNVLSDSHRHNFDKYLDTMKELGYNNHSKVMNAKFWGVPQNRERIFIVSIRDDIKKKDFKFPISSLEKQMSLFNNNLIKVKKRVLADVLQDEVDEKYYLSDEYIVDCLYPVTDKQPKQILELNQIGGIDEDIARLEKGAYSQGNRIYSIAGVSCTLSSNGGGRGAKTGLYLVEDESIVPEATKKGYDIAEEGDSINYQYLGSKTRRGRVGKSVANTLQTSCNQATIHDFRIRKLTPLECFRLMDFDDQDYYKVKDALEKKFYNGRDDSNRQCYKMAGNSIVVKCLEVIFTELFKEEINNEE